ncbi:putative ribonuclease H-like domain-containing protein, partial [Tanacetum coccineum]
MMTTVNKKVITLLFLKKEKHLGVLLPLIQFAKGNGSPNRTKNVRKLTVKYAELYRKTPLSPRNLDALIIKEWESETESEVDYTISESSAAKKQIWVPKVPTVGTKVPTVGQKFPTVKPTVAAKMGNKGKAVKASARWIWKPKQNDSGQGSNDNGVSGKSQDIIDDKGFWDIGCLRHMTGNISYLSDFEPYDGGYVSFGDGGGKITGKGTIKTDCLKGKQHRASCKSKLVNSVSKPLHTLHMDLFGPTSISSLNHKWYCLVVTDDFSRFTWTFFLKTKDETFRILRNFTTEIKNLKDLKVKVIRCDNRGEFRNKEIDEFRTRKGIKREFSNARTPQQNGIAARTMLADAKFPVTFWAEAVNTA